MIWRDFKQAFGGLLFTYLVLSLIAAIASGGRHTRPEPKQYWRIISWRVESLTTASKNLTNGRPLTT